MAEIVLLELNFRDCGMIMLQPYLFLYVCYFSCVADLLQMFLIVVSIRVAVASTLSD